MKKEFCVKLVIYKDYIEMHGQQNIKFQDIRVVQWRGLAYSNTLNFCVL